VAIQDLASFATLGVEPGEFAGRRVTIASDELTAEQAPSSRTPSADTSTPPSSQARSCRRDSAPCWVARANGTPCRSRSSAPSVSRGRLAQLPSMAALAARPLARTMSARARRKPCLIG
jgi:hypothetical protein